jgi:hypothetical protein
MASDPRPRSRASSDASNGSRYSLNLDALPSASTQDESMLYEDGVHHDVFDVVRTDEIDGPTDFTQNMEYWMQLKLPNIVKPTKMEGMGKQDLEDYISSDEDLSVLRGDSDTSKQTTVAVKTQSIGVAGTIQREHVSNELDGEDNKANANNTIDPQQIGMSYLDDVPDLDGPLGDTRSQKASPSLRRTPRLQAFVEDHDDTSNRPRGIRSTSSSAVGDTIRHSMYGQYVAAKRMIEHSGLASDTAKLVDQTSTLGTDAAKSLDNTLQALQQELDTVKAKAESDLKNMQEEWRAKLEEERAAAEAQYEKFKAQLRNLDKVLDAKNAVCEDLQRIKRELESKRDSLMESLSKATTSLHEFSEAANKRETSLYKELEKKANEVRFAIESRDKSRRDTEAQLESAKKRIASLERQVGSNVSECSSNDGFDRVSDLEGELSKSQQLLQDRDTHIRELEKQLMEASSALNDSEKKYKSLQSNRSDSRQGHQTEIGQTPTGSETQMSSLTLQLQALERQLNSANQTISSLRRDLENSAEVSRVAREKLMDERRESELCVDKLRDENGHLEAIRLDSDERITQLNRDITELKRDHADEIERIKNGHILHVSGVRKKAEDAVRRTSDVIEKWKSEAKRLKEEMAQGQEKTAANVSDLEDLRNELLVANDRAEDMQRERDNLKLDAAERVPALHASRIEAIRAKKRGDELQKEVLILRAVDTQVDKKIAAMMQKRDQYWKQKMDMMEKEMEIRGKLLMLEWGRNEVGGPKIPQGYKYQQYRRA